MRRLGRLLLLALPVACGPSQKDLESAQIHFDLGVNAMENGHDAQSALRELRMSLQANPSFGDAYNALGLVYHLMLHRPEEAVNDYPVVGRHHRVGKNGAVRRDIAVLR